jgi:hypothetical protein
MYLSTYSKFRCDKCAAVNWLYEGDVMDMTGFDPEGYKCWNCGEFEMRDEDYAENGIQTKDL